MADLTIAVDGAQVPVHIGPAPDAVLDAAALAALALKVGFSDLDARLPSLFKWIPSNLQGAIIARTSTTDVTSYIQAAIDEIESGGGGTILVPDGLYNLANVELKRGVTLRSLASHHGYLASSPYYSVKFKMVTGQTGWILDTPATATGGCFVDGINFEGLGAGTSVGGVRYQDVTFGGIKNCSFNSFAEQAVLDVSGVCNTYEDIETVNCLLDITRAAKAGTFEVHGADHQVHRIEATASRFTVTDANLYCCAIMIGATNCDVIAVRGQISDIGVHISGALNRIIGGRADLNAGHGWEVTGSGNAISGSFGLSNSQDTTNTYDNWNVSGTNNIFDGVMSNTLTAKLPRYGFNDTSAVSAANKNRWANAVSLGLVGTAERNVTAGNAAAMALWPRGGAKTLTPDSATPAVDGYEAFITLNTVATTITNFTGGVNGQVLDIVVSDANTTFQHNGSTIITPNAGNVKARNGGKYRFEKNGAWRLVAEDPALFNNVSADKGDAAASLQFRVSEPTQQWNTPLGADRAVTLSTTGAVAGAKFRIVRTAAATGAFNLNVGTGPLKALAVGTWCDVEYNGSAWMLTAYGAL